MNPTTITDQDKFMAAVIFGILAACLLLILSFHVLCSKMEAEAYTRLTGKPVSTWDAMFLDLRVQESIE